MSNVGPHMADLSEDKVFRLVYNRQTTTDLYRLGNKHDPKLKKLRDKDLPVNEQGFIVKKPSGPSVFLSITELEKKLEDTSGNVWQLERGTPMPSEFKFKLLDEPTGHFGIIPTVSGMTHEEFSKKIQCIPWTRIPEKREKLTV